MNVLIRPALILVLLFTLLTGLLYPLLITGIAQAAMPHRAGGSLVVVDDRVIGSELIGQSFTAPGYFHGRPSAAGYDASASSGSNLGPLDERLHDRIDSLAGLYGGAPGAAGIPADLVTASGSGLDPHISPASAYIQIERIARARGIDTAALRRMVDERIESRTLGLLGEPRLNVLAINRALDELAK